jgi:hypothetical protein
MAASQTYEEEDSVKIKMRLYIRMKATGDFKDENIVVVIHIRQVKSIIKVEHAISQPRFPILKKISQHVTLCDHEKR